ncbi:MAG: ABC transporter permease [Phycisphaerales bacterium JB043]
MVALLSLIPIVYLLIRSSEGGSSSISDILFHSSMVRLLLRSVLLGICVAGVSLLLAALLGVITVAADLPLRRTLGVLVIVPLAVPCYVAASAWIASTSHNGSVRSLMEAIGIGSPSRPEGFLWTWCVLTCFTYPYALLPLRAGLRRLDACQYESARSSGASRTRGALTTLVPQLTPAAITGVVLVLLYTLAEFGAVTLFRLDTFTRVIYQQYQSSFDRSSAAVTCLVLVMLIIAVMVVSERLARRTKDACCASGCEDSLVIRLGRWRWPACAVTLLFVLATSGFVVFELVSWAGRGAPEAFAGSLITPASNSVLLAMGGAVAAVVASYPAAWIAARMRGSLATIFERTTHFGFGLPGIVVALGLAAGALRLSGLGLYQSWALIVLAYVILFLPQSAGALRASLSGAPPVFEDAATSLGASGSRVFARVTLPMIRPGIIAGGTLVFLSSMKELPATLLLAPPGVHTLSTRVWGFMEEAMFAQAALPALGLIACSSLIVGLISIAEREQNSPVLAATTLDSPCSCERMDCADCGKRAPTTSNDHGIVSLTIGESSS